VCLDAVVYGAARHGAVRQNKGRADNDSTDPALEGLSTVYIIS